MNKYILFAIVGIVVYFLYIKLRIQQSTVSSGAISQGSPSTGLNMTPLTNSVPIGVSPFMPIDNPPLTNTTGAVPTSPTTVMPPASSPSASFGTTTTSYDGGTTYGSPVVMHLAKMLVA